MIQLRKIRQLNLEAPYPPLTAASGVVKVNHYLYVIGDDENHLGVFDTNQEGSPGRAHKLFEGKLPEEKKERKLLKADLEALTFLPEQSVLLAIPSGSKPNRYRGALVPLDKSGAPSGSATVIDLSWLYLWLQKAIDPPNLESAALVGNVLYLIHRGNKKGDLNALISIPLMDFFLGRQDQAQIRTIRNFAEVDGVPLTITDAANLDNKSLVFTAAAENTENSFDDGPCLGSGLGVMDLNGNVLSFERVDACKKLEGVYAQRQENQWKLWLVNDEDDRSCPSELWEAFLSIG